MADSSDSEQFSDGKSDDDFEVLSGSSESEDEMNEVPMNANPWFRVLPPEIDYLHDQRFVENSDPQNVPAADAKPIDYFLLFLTLDFLRHIVRETNRYAQDFITSRQRIRRFSRLHSGFKVGAVTLAEMKGFISVILNMGLIRKPSITEYWNTKFPSQDTVWFRDIFSRNRFQSILKFFHIVDNTTLPNRNDDNYSPTSKWIFLIDNQNYITNQNRTLVLIKV
ncbi:unnamed protein product [Mytilus coruscus]|uniref:PiggyBac transposable element-derived protein domain-containing protein n=1 Tax=Mytilus coruscus TaxID=42192 RepID=A0A6J8EKK7_MYTCO|nr:unnamed protein product [Mytilus coruscus]